MVSNVLLCCFPNPDSCTVELFILVEMLWLCDRVMDIILCDSFEAFLLKLSYTLLTTNKRLLMSMSSMEDILEFLTSTLPSNLSILFTLTPHLMPRLENF